MRGQLRRVNCTCMSFGGINLKKYSLSLIIWAVTVKQENKKNTEKRQLTEITAAKSPLDNKTSNSTSDLHINESQGQYGCKDMYSRSDLFGSPGSPPASIDARQLAGRTR